ncbi:MAG: tRNA (N(6)-L-threonylcarbamoyladenosine(37)-C(2))-methylthiotransferase MtaB [Spirochaetia bacterium]
MRASLYTFGCKLNQFETEALASEFRGQGFSLVSPDEAAEVYIINTCTVTSKSEQKARRLIRKISRQRPRALLIVTGCYAQLNRDDLAGLGENVRVVSQEDKAGLIELPATLKRRNETARGAIAPVDLSAVAGDPFRFRVDRFSYHSRAFLKVQDGCDYRCSYCRVPLARGKSVSLDPEEAVKRARETEQRGYREVVLTGVNLTAYRYGEIRLPGLLSRLLGGTQRLRLRLSSLEPEMIKPELAEVLRDRRICPHFHIPIQSGSNTILLRMRRRYRVEQIVRVVELFREAKQDPFVAADIIVGFPGETDQDFLASFRLVETLKLSKLHVFPFSPRPGTPAEHMTDHVPERIRDERVGNLLSLSDSLHELYAGRWVGKWVEVVLERERSQTDSGSWQGLSENYLKVLVEGVPDQLGAPGILAEALIEQAGNPCHGRFTGTA